MGVFDFLTVRSCALCGRPSRPGDRTQLSDGAVICQTCVVEKCSPWVQIGRLRKADLDEHIRYMAAQDRLYDEQFRNAPDLETIGSSERGVRFADSVGMFDLVSPETTRHTMREAFRLDRVADVRSTSTRHDAGEHNDPVEFDTVGLAISLHGHPWVSHADLTIGRLVRADDLRPHAAVRNVTSAFDRRLRGSAPHSAWTAAADAAEQRSWHQRTATTRDDCPAPGPVPENDVR